MRIDRDTPSVPIDYEIIVNCKPSRGMSNHFMGLVMQQYPKVHQSKLEMHCEMVTANLIQQVQSDSAVLVGYTRCNGSVRAKRYSNLNYRGYYLKMIVDVLVEHGYVVNHNGEWNSSDQTKGYQSRIQINQKLVDYVGTNHYYHRRLKYKELIRLKDHYKKLINYTDSELTNGMRKKLKSVNELITRHKFSVSGYGWVDLSKCEIYRVFNGNFHNGGRFYGGWWINLPSEIRKRIHVDGNPMVELDYGAHHIHLLYGKIGSVCPEEPYLLSDQDPKLRPLMKMVNLIGICAKNRYVAISEIEKAAKQLELDGEIVQPPDLNCEEVLEQFIYMHEPIRDYYCSGVATELQNLDSRIAEYVLMELREREIVCLPVHDSFIVMVEHQDTLKQVMEEAPLALGLDYVPPID